MPSERKEGRTEDRRETRHLKKGLWGLVQARRIWNEELNSHVESEGFPVTLKDPAVYVKGFRNREDFAAGRHWEGTRRAFERKDINTKYGITSREILFVHFKDVLALQC